MLVLPAMQLFTVGLFLATKNTKNREEIYGVANTIGLMNSRPFNDKPAGDRVLLGEKRSPAGLTLNGKGGLLFPSKGGDTESLGKILFKHTQSFFLPRVSLLLHRSEELYHCESHDSRRGRRRTQT